MTRRPGRKRKMKPIRIAHGFDGRCVISPVQVDDPFEPTKKLTAMANVAGRINSERRHLDDGQVAIAYRIQTLVELSGERGAPACDPAKPYVDISRIDNAIAQVKSDAAKELAQIRSLLGNNDYRLIRWFVTDETARHLNETAYDARYRRRRIRDALDQVAALWGYGKGRARLLRARHQRSHSGGMP